MCTVRHFPNQIEHTIEWSLEFFNSNFYEGPQDCQKYCEDPATYQEKLPSMGNTTEGVRKLKSIQNLLSRSDAGFDKCVDLAVAQFTEQFDYAIQQLLVSFPKDHVDSNGNPFWSGPKRAPSAIKFDANDEMHLLFVVSGANLIAQNMGIEMCKDVAKIKSIASAIPYVVFNRVVITK